MAQSRGPLDPARSKSSTTGSTGQEGAGLSVWFARLGILGLGFGAGRSVLVCKIRVVGLWGLGFKGIHCLTIPCL